MGAEPSSPPPSSPAPRPESVFLTTLLGALLGAMLLLSLLDLCAVAEYRAGSSVIGAAGAGGHEILRKPASWVWPRFGLPQDLGIRKDIQTVYVLETLGSIGLVLGALAGLVVGLVRRGRGPATSSSPAPTLPKLIPLGLAVLGLFYQGYVWCNLAVLLLPRARWRRWHAVAVMAVSFVAVVAWTWAMEVDWSEGWSKHYPWSRTVFFFIGHELGAKE